MSDLEYDGLCGVPSRFTLWDGTRLRCRYEMGHAGGHDWKKYESQFRLMGGITRDEVRALAKSGSPAARAILGIPLNCSCTPLFTSDRELVEYIFSPDCEAHEKR